jgi:hypothetical protein
MEAVTGEKYITFIFQKDEVFDIPTLSLSASANGYDGEYPHVFTIVSSGQVRVSYTRASPSD